MNYLTKKRNALQAAQRERDEAAVGPGTAARPEGKGNPSFRGSKDRTRHEPPAAWSPPRSERSGPGGSGRRRTAWADFLAGTVQATEKWDDIFKNTKRNKKPC